MQLITILLTVLFPIASATPFFPASKPRIPHSLLSVFPRCDQPTETIIVGPIPTQWRHTHRPLLHSSASDIKPDHNSDELVDAISAPRRLPRAIDGDSNGAATANTEEVLDIAPERRILLPPPPMTNVEICEALCSTDDAEPCGPCEAVSDDPDTTIPPSNAERTDTVRARTLKTPQDKAWHPLWRCLLQCLEDRRLSCDMCNEYWVLYQSTLSLRDFEDPEMKSYIEMTRCLSKCDRGRFDQACLHCEVLWNQWEQVLLPYVETDDPATAGGVVKRGAFREDMIGMTMCGVLEGCDPEKPENPHEICLHCRKMMSVFPPVMLHNWASDRPIVMPESYHDNEGPGLTDNN